MKVVMRVLHGLLIAHNNYIVKQLGWVINNKLPAKQEKTFSFSCDDEVLTEGLLL